mgnify:CR=1 FL=1
MRRGGGPGVALAAMVLLLLVAAPTYFAIGEASDGIVALVALVPIIAVGWVLEARAERTLDRLRGLVAATDGNISARSPEGTFLTTRTGLPKGSARPEDILDAALAQPFCFAERATIRGTSGDDVLVGTDGDDVIAALALSPASASAQQTPPPKVQPAYDTAGWTLLGDPTS